MAQQAQSDVQDNFYRSAISAGIAVATLCLSGLLSRVMTRKINQLLAERRAVFNQVSELTNRIKHQAKQA